MTKIFSFVSSKGGTGKTTTVYNFAHSLAHRGNKILLIDLDEQGNLSEMFTEEFDNATTSVKSIFLYNEKAEDLITKVDDNLSIIFADLELGILKNDLQTKSNKDYLLLTWFHQNKNVLSEYDYILIDLHPEISTITLNAFLVSDSIIAPVNADRYGETSVKLLDIRYTELKKVLVDPKTQETYLTANLLFFINRFDQNKIISRSRLDAIKSYNMQSGQLYSGFIPVREIFNRSLEYETGVQTFAALDMNNYTDLSSADKQRLKSDVKSAKEIVPLLDSLIDWVISQ